MGLFALFRKKKNELPEEARKWNKIWDLWVEGKACSPYAELMRYHSEVNNGGHGQYFTNVENTGDVEKELAALAQILSPKLNANVKRAYAAHQAEAGDDAAYEISEQCDDVFYENEDEILGALKEYATKMEV